jgi:hypothetical protein
MTHEARMRDRKEKRRVFTIPTCIWRAAFTGVLVWLAINWLDSKVVL